MLVKQALTGGAGDSVFAPPNLRSHQVEGAAVPFCSIEFDVCVRVCECFCVSDATNFPTLLVSSSPSHPSFIASLLGMWTNYKPTE